MALKFILTFIVLFFATITRITYKDDSDFYKAIVGVIAFVLFNTALIFWIFS